MEHQFTYRPAEIADALKLSVLFKQVYIQTYGTEGVSTEFANFITHRFSVERIEEIIRRDPNCLTIAVYKDNFVGVAEVEFDKETPIGNITAPELSKLYVLEWFCGMGVGYGLTNEVERTLTQLGYKQYWLWVLISNTRAISFYERQGFEWIGNAFFHMEANSYENKVLVKKLR